MRQSGSILHMESNNVDARSSSRLSPFSSNVVSTVLSGKAFGTARLPRADETAQVISARLVRELMVGVHGELAEPIIALHGLLIDGDVDLSYCEWRGQLDLSYCRITGSLRIAHAIIRGRVCLDGAALSELDTNYAVIDGPFLFRRGYCSKGLFGLAMKVSGSLNLRETELWAPAEKPNRCAVELYRARLGDVFLTEAKLYGGLYGSGMTIDRNLRLQGAIVLSREVMGWETGPDSIMGAICLAGATIGSALYASWKDGGRPSWYVDGRVVFTRLSCTTLRMRVADLIGRPLSLEYLIYVRLVGVTPHEWLALLGRTEGVGSQPYARLAAYCGELGLTDLQRKVLVAHQRRMTSEFPRRSIEYWRRKLWAWSVQYGYRPGRAIAWLIGCTLLCAVILLIGGDFIVSQAGSHFGGGRGVKSFTEAITISMDNVLPFAGLGVANEWSAAPENALQAAWLVLFVGLKFLGWTMAAVGLASVTGILKKP
jgi:hypothetical protein